MYAVPPTFVSGSTPLDGTTASVWKRPLDSECVTLPYFVIQHVFPMRCAASIGSVYWRIVHHTILPVQFHLLNIWDMDCAPTTLHPATKCSTTSIRTGGAFNNVAPATEPKVDQVGLSWNSKRTWYNRCTSWLTSNNSIILPLHIIPTSLWGWHTPPCRKVVGPTLPPPPDNPFSLISSLTLSNLLGLPLFLLPRTFISIALLPTQCTYVLIKCPHHYNTISLTLFAIDS